MEPLEGRTLLSVYTGPTASRPVFYHGTVFTISVSGGGYETIHPMKHGQIEIDLSATNPNSALSITAQARTAHFNNQPLQIGKLRVKTGLLGAINAGAADLQGPVTPLASSLSALQFNSIGKNASISVGGDVAQFTAPLVNLGPAGQVHIGGNISSNFSGTLNIDGGQFFVGNDISGALTPSSITVSHGGILSVGHDVTGGMQVGGNVAIDTNGLVIVNNNLGNLSIGKQLTIDHGGRFVVGGDVTGTATLGQGASLNNNAMIAVGRDLAGGLTVTGDLTLDNGANVIVGRDLSSLTINGNYHVAPAGGELAVGGNVKSFTITGAYQGKGSTSSTDLSVGLDLDNFTVIGGTPNLGSIDNANINVGKNIQSLDVRHGIFNSLITAGVLIDGTGNNPNQTQGSVGPDGPDAVFDSQILAGVQIRNLTLSGNVRSDWVTNPNPTGYRTRIVAGETRQGTFLSGGNIDNFQITGALMDSVLAASVPPNGGNGTLPVTAYGAPPPAVGTTPGDGGFNTYDAPGGTITGGTVGAPVPYLNYSELSYYNETLTGVTYDTAIDPTIDDAILPGSINASFANSPVPPLSLKNASTPLPLPSKSTVLGGVISTPHGDNNDFAGIFAADTRGVFVGTLPSS